MESRSTREQQQPWSYSCSFAASFAWPPRSYSCSFCKREFRSAQALGGHMNVHRRDRARLRHCSPPPHPAHPVAAAANLNPRSAAATPLPNLNYPPPPSLYHPNSRSKNHDMHIIPSVTVKARALEVNLELGFGVQCCTEDDGLDLELRLGCS